MSNTISISYEQTRQIIINDVLPGTVIRINSALLGNNQYTWQSDIAIIDLYELEQNKWTLVYSYPSGYDANDEMDMLVNEF